MSMAFQIAFKYMDYKYLKINNLKYTRPDSHVLECSDIPRQAFWKVDDQTIWRDGSKVWVEPTYPPTSTPTSSSSLSTATSPQEYGQIKKLMTTILEKEQSIETESHVQHIMHLIIESVQSVGTFVTLGLVSILAFFFKLCKQNPKAQMKEGNELKPTVKETIDIEKSKFSRNIFNSLNERYDVKNNDYCNIVENIFKITKLRKL